ncbi:MAG: helix-turn-helix transcriptional regulator [Akkermansia sp.]|nr:helix-turn-helix transcriptional regulator [Akkermansia sp.]
MNEKWPIPFNVVNAARKLGSDIRDARRRRRLTMELVAGRAMISRATLGRIERGDAAVSMGSYAKVLFALGMLPLFRDMAGLSRDPVGQALDVERLPKRVRMKD